MKIAVFHNYLDNIGGAEMVALFLTRELNADLYTTNINQEKINKMGFADLESRILSVGGIPKKAPFRQQLAFWKFRRLNLKKKYDFYIIAGDWAMSAAINNHPNIWYVHSPLNELWEFKDYIKKNILSSWKIIPYEIWVSFNRYLSLSYAKKVDNWVCNSQNTKNRIKKFYNQDAEIINPPIETKKFNSKESKSYWLSVNRLITHKRIDLQMEAFKKLPNDNLIIVGSYEVGVEQFESYKKYLEKIKPSNVEIIHWVNDDELKELYNLCRGFITTAQDEDFGMTVIEAMAAGKPVIAPNDGGYKETINKETGILINEINSEKISEAVKKINEELKKDPDKYRVNCQSQAAKFDINVFIEKITKIILG